jgi:alpha-amylase
MLRISEKVRRAGAKRDGETRGAGTRGAEAREALWRGQCNCAYWHGVFGGLYLNYLRQAVWRNLVLAERLADDILAGTKPWIRFVQEDVDADGAREIIVESDALVVTLKPDSGLSAQSWEIRSSNWNVLDTLARRPEAYHEKVRRASDDGEKVASIHDRIRVKEPGLEAFLSYDPHPWRGALQDRLFGPSATFRDARDSTRVLAELFRVSAVAEGHKSGNAVVISANGTAETAGGRAAIRKTLRFESGSTLAEIGYSIRWDGPHQLDAIFAVEWNVGLLAGDADDRYILADGRKPGDPRPASEGEFTASLVEAVDGWRRVKARFRFTEPFLVWRYPVWTVSQSEGGFERTYQSTVLAFCRKLSIAPGSSVNFAFQHDVLDLE